MLRKLNVLIIKEEREFDHPKARKIVSLVVHSEKKNSESFYLYNLFVCFDLSWKINGILIKKIWIVINDQSSTWVNLITSNDQFIMKSLELISNSTVLTIVQEN